MHARLKPYSANRYANYLVAHNLRTKKIYINGKYQAMRYVTFNMVAQHNTIRAGKFKDIVNLYARKTEDTLHQKSISLMQTIISI